MRPPFKETNLASVCSIVLGLTCILMLSRAVPKAHFIIAIGLFTSLRRLQRNEYRDAQGTLRGDRGPRDNIARS
jgi:hypothetical protein